MINLTDEEWEVLFNKSDETLEILINNLPPSIKIKAEEVGCCMDRYTANENWHMLGCYMKWTNGPIFIYVGQIYEDCNKNMDDAMKSVKQVYLHELAHAVGNLEEYEVKERGL